MSIENFEEGYTSTDSSNYASVNEEQISDNNTLKINKPLELSSKVIAMPESSRYSFLDRTTFFGYKNKTILMYIVILIIIYYLYSCK
jgi:hypothetical protein